MKVLYFDTETTGLNPVHNDIIQIAGVIEIDGKIMEEFNLTCQPFSFDNISKQALEINKRTVDEIREFQKPAFLHADLKKLFSKYVDQYNKNDKFIPAGQNVRFDIDFLHQFFQKNNDKYFGSWLKWQGVDLLALASILQYAGKFTLENLKLETLAKHFRVELEAHDALEDIKATRLIIKKALGAYLVK